MVTWSLMSYALYTCPRICFNTVEPQCVSFIQPRSQWSGLVSHLTPREFWDTLDWFTARKWILYVVPFPYNPIQSDVTQPMLSNIHLDKPCVMFSCCWVFRRFLNPFGLKSDSPGNGSEFISNSLDKPYKDHLLLCNRIWFDFQYWNSPHKQVHVVWLLKNVWCVIPLFCRVYCRDAPESYKGVHYGYILDTCRSVVS